MKKQSKHIQENEQLHLEKLYAAARREGIYRADGGKSIIAWVAWRINVLEEHLQYIIDQCDDSELGKKIKSAALLALSFENSLKPKM